MSTSAAGTSVGPPSHHRGAGAGRRLATLLLFAVPFAGLVALGVWQLQRLAWKLDLIARVDARVHAAAVEAPRPAAWPGVSAARDEYRRVRVHGRFLAGRDTRVQAVTELGPGRWLLSPLQRDDGTIVLVNRGFVPDDWRGAVPADPAAPTTVIGLLRLSEPGGGFLRRNAPDADRWYSRDVAAIAASRGLAHVAPYFIDAERAAAAPGPPRWPLGGMTVTTFRNPHLVYALTWFGLASMVAWAAWRVRREQRRRASAPPAA